MEDSIQLLPSKRDQVLIIDQWSLVNKHLLQLNDTYLSYIVVWHNFRIEHIAFLFFSASHIVLDSYTKCLSVLLDRAHSIFSLLTHCPRPLHIHWYLNVLLISLLTHCCLSRPTHTHWYHPSVCPGTVTAHTVTAPSSQTWKIPSRLGKRQHERYPQNWSSLYCFFWNLCCI